MEVEGEITGVKDSKFVDGSAITRREIKTALHVSSFFFHLQIINKIIIAYLLKKSL